MANVENALDLRGDDRLLQGTPGSPQAFGQFRMGWQAVAGRQGPSRRSAIQEIEREP